MENITSHYANESGRWRALATILADDVGYFRDQLAQQDLSTEDRMHLVSLDVTMSMIKRALEAHEQWEAELLQPAEQGAV